RADLAGRVRRHGERPLHESVVRARRHASRSHQDPGRRSRDVISRTYAPKTAEVAESAGGPPVRSRWFDIRVRDFRGRSTRGEDRSTPILDFRRFHARQPKIAGGFRDLHACKATITVALLQLTGA